MFSTSGGARESQEARRRQVAVAAEVVLRAQLPPVEDRLVLPVVVGAPHDEDVLSPDEALGEVEPCARHRLAEEDRPGVGMEDVKRSAGLGHDMHPFEGVLDAYFLPLCIG